MKKLNILFYIPYLSRRDGGIFQYSMRVIEALRESQNNLIVLNDTEFEMLTRRFDASDNITVVKQNLSLPFKISNKFRQLSEALHETISFFPEINRQTLPNSFLRKYQIDLIHSPTQAFTTNKTPFIFTLHDVQELHMPGNFSPLERELRARNNRIGCERADRIVVSYNHVKKDLVLFFQFPKDRIDVVFIGTSDNGLPIRENAVDDFEKFLLYPAATWPHKNHLNLIRAFEKAKSQQSEFKDYRLVCTGHKTDHMTQIEGLLAQSDAAGDIEFKGVVSDEELKKLYSRAAAVVVPTKYEAGSFPLMEALVQQIPVICSNVTSLPETIDDPAFVFDPDNTEEMAEKIVKIACNREFREKNIRNAERVRERLIDVELAKEFDSIYVRAINSKQN